MRWAPADVIHNIAIRRRQFSWPEMECLALAVLSMSNLLRLGEAWSTSQNGPGKLVFKEEKNRPGV